jgi:AraC-like DNA-binding protein
MNRGRREASMFRPTKIRHYVAFMKSRGFGAAEVLAGSHIEPAQLHNPAHLIDFAAYQTVVANMIRLTGKQGIGLEVGKESELTDFGIVGHAMMSSKTGRDALQLWLRYSNALVGMLITLHLEEHEHGAWSLTISEMRPMGFLYNFGVEEILTIAIKIGEVQTRQPFAPAAIELSYPAPAHHALYMEYLGCVPRFNTGTTRVRFEAPDLEQPIRGSDEEFNAICLQHCSQILRQIAEDSPLVSRIRSLLLSRIKGLPSLQDLARELCMSDRTLRRRLQAEGHSYQNVINEFRMDLAKEYLGTSRMTPKETAYLLGFKDANAFRRAFKAWTGQTIHDFREEVEACPLQRERPRA